MTWSCGNVPSYKDEAGFLTNFTAEENAVIKAVTQKSILSEVDYGALPEDKISGSEKHIYNGNVLECPQNYSSAYYEQLTDKIFLLDVQQAKNVYDNLGQYLYRGYVSYCLRTPYTYYGTGASDGSYSVRLVNSSSLGVAIQNAVPKNIFCLRPAFFLNSQSEIICGSGTEENPYTFVEHALTYHEGHEATCTEGGNSEYWTCESNYRIYSDANAENELSKIPEIAAGHSWNKWIISDNTAERVCTRDSAHTENRRVKISDIEAQAYTGDVIEPAITVNIGDITLVKGTDYTVEYRNNINVGTANAVIKFTGNCTGETAQTFTIEKATPTVVAPTAKLLTYNGTAQELVEAGSAAGGELQYSLSQDSGYSTDIPTAEHAGTYTVWYEVVGNDNYNDVSAASVEVTIYNAGQTPPVVNINYADETLSTAETMEYSKNGVDWLRCTDNMAIDTFGYNGESIEVYIRTAESADKDASSAVKIIIPARPSAPSVKAGIGVIMNTTDAMEYRTENGEWINAQGDEITGLEAGVYEVRYKAASSAFASAAARVEVNPRSVPTATPDLSPSPTPTASVNPTPTPTVSPTPTPTASVSPTSTPTPTASASPTPKPTAKPTHGGSSSIRIQPKTTSSPTPTATPSATPDVPPVETDNPVNNWFVDVHKDAWYYDAVRYIFENGLMLGVSEMKFAPNENITRGMFLTVLYRIEGEPEINSSVNFTDINGEYYADAVKWASINKIVEGYTDEIFAPDKNITREQMAAIVYRYAAFKQYNTNTAGTLSYTDTADISDYAKNAVIWNIQNGIMFGNEDNTFSPAANTTRAQAAAVFERIIGNLK